MSTVTCLAFVKAVPEGKEFQNVSGYTRARSSKFSQQEAPVASLAWRLSYCIFRVPPGLINTITSLISPDEHHLPTGINHICPEDAKPKSLSQITLSFWVIQHQKLDRLDGTAHR